MVAAKALAFMSIALLLPIAHVVVCGSPRRARAAPVVLVLLQTVVLVLLLVVPAILGVPILGMLMTVLCSMASSLSYWLCCMCCPLACGHASCT